MRYVYTTYDHRGNRLDVTTRIEEVKIPEVMGGYIQVTDNLKKQADFRLITEDDLLGWITTLERNAAWNDNRKSRVNSIPPDIKSNAGMPPFDFLKDEDGFHAKLAAERYSAYDTPELRQSKIDLNATVNKPPHYQAYFKNGAQEYQWLETMQYTRFREPERMLAALELQVRKYLDRLGSKDDELQELAKALFYLKFMVAYKINGCKPIPIADIDTIISKG